MLNGVGGCRRKVLPPGWDASCGCPRSAHRRPCGTDTCPAAGWCDPHKNLQFVPYRSLHHSLHDAVLTIHGNALAIGQGAQRVGGTHDDSLAQRQADNGGMAVGAGFLHNDTCRITHIGQIVVVGEMGNQNAAGLEFLGRLGRGSGRCRRCPWRSWFRCQRRITGCCPPDAP